MASGLSPNKVVSTPRVKIIALFISLGGALIGYGVGSIGGSLIEAWLWVALLGWSCYFLTLSQIEPSPRQNLIAIAFHGIQVGIFASIGALLSWTTGDATAFPLCFKLGFLLSILTGIVDWELTREMPEGFFFLLSLFIGGGASAGAIVALVFQFNVVAGATMGSLIGILLPYYFFQINARPVFLTFVISTLGGMQVINAMGWGLLQGYYYATALTFSIALVLMTVDYLQIHAWKKSRRESLLPYLRL